MILYPELSQNNHTTIDGIKGSFIKLEAELVQIMNATKACCDCNSEAISEAFFSRLPSIYYLLNTDIRAIHLGDPAAHTAFEVIRAYPGFYGLCFFVVSEKFCAQHNI